MTLSASLLALPACGRSSLFDFESQRSHGGGGETNSEISMSTGTGGSFSWGFGGMGGSPNSAGSGGSDHPGGFGGNSTTIGAGGGLNAGGSGGHLNIGGSDDVGGAGGTVATGGLGGVGGGDANLIGGFGGAATTASAGGVLNTGGFGGMANIGGEDGIGGMGGETAAGGSGGTPLGHEIEMISIDSSEIPGNGYSSQPSASYDGSFVTFTSYATNLVTGGTLNGKGHVYLRNRKAGTTEIVSVDNNGVQGNLSSESSSISGDGNRVSFLTYATNLEGVLPPDGQFLYVRDRLASNIFLASQHDMGQPERVGGDADDGRYPLTFDGGSLLYISDDLPDLVFRNLGTGVRTVLGQAMGFEFEELFLTPNNQYAVYQADYTFLYDFQNDTHELVSISSLEEAVVSRGASVSEDGRYVAFEDTHDEIYLRDLLLGTTIFVGKGENPQISASGHYIAYEDNKTFVYNSVAIYEVQTGSTVRIGQWGYGSAPTIQAETPYWSGDGQYLVFSSSSDEVVSGDENNVSDVFVVGVNRLWE